MGEVHPPFGGQPHAPYSHPFGTLNGSSCSARLKRKHKMPSKKTRRYTYLTDEEDKEIMARAKEAEMPVAKYLRLVGLGVRPRSKVDFEVGRKMFGELKDLRRLGNLYKMELMKTEDAYQNESYRSYLMENHQKISSIADKIDQLAKRIMKE